MLKSDEGVVAYQAKDSSGTYMVIFNANNEPAAVEGIGAGKYNVLAGDGTVYDENAKDAFVRKAPRTLQARCPPPCSRSPLPTMSFPLSAE